MKASRKFGLLLHSGSQDYRDQCIEHFGKKVVVDSMEMAVTLIPNREYKPKKTIGWKYSDKRRRRFSKKKV